MIEFGATLRKAREAKGLTMKQIAERTNLMVQTVENLENENFAKIAAPIYGRGFVKLYCEVVDLDPKPLIAEFMDIYNGNRIPTIRMRQQDAPTITPSAAPQPAPQPAIQTAPQPAPQPAIVAKPSATEQPQQMASDLFSFNQEVQREPEVKPEAPSIAQIAQPQVAQPQIAQPQVAQPQVAQPQVAQPQVAQPQTIVAQEPSKPTQSTPLPPRREVRTFPRTTGPSRYVAPKPIDDDKPRLPRFHISIPPAVWRLMIIICIAVGILCGAWFGLKALYNATVSSAQNEEATSTEQQQEQVVPKDNQQKDDGKTQPQPRQPMTLPQLYID